MPTCIYIKTHKCLSIYIPKCIHSNSMHTYIDSFAYLPV